MPELSDFGFAEHPFSLVPGAGVTHWAGMEYERSLLGDIVESVLTSDTGLSEFVIVFGSYGAGKSHALKYLTTAISETRADHFKACALYLPKVRVDQKVDFVRLYKEIVRELGRKFFRRLASKISQRIDAAADALGDEMDREKEKELRRQDPNYFLNKVLESVNDEDRPMIELFRMLESGEEKVLTYLLEGKPAVGEPGFTPVIDTDYAATRMLASIFRAMSLKIGNQEPTHQAVYLFIDEVEDMWDLKPVEQMAIWNGIRELLNRLPQNFCLILAFTGDAALLEATIPQAIAERISRQNIELQSLDAEGAKAFISEHLSNFRRMDFPVSQPYYPFSEEAIDYVLETIVVMVPRRIFRSLRTVLERAIRREGLQPNDEIDAQMAEEILVAMGM